MKLKFTDLFKIFWNVGRYQAFPLLAFDQEKKMVKTQFRFRNLLSTDITYSIRFSSALSVIKTDQLTLTFQLQLQKAKINA